MHSSLDDAVFELGSAIGSALVAPVGAYRFDLVTASWWWSDEVYAMYGYERGEVVPTSELMLAHNHPDDRQVNIPALDARCRTGRPFSYIHRILDAKQSVKTLAISGQGRLGDSTTSVLGATGFIVDVSDVGRATYQAEVSEALGEILESRSIIEQAKGILMLTYGLDDEDAFALLRHHSSIANVKIRVLADGLLELARSGAITSLGMRAVDAFSAKAPARR